MRLAEASPGGWRLSAAVSDDQRREPAHSQLLLRTHHEAAEETQTLRCFVNSCEQLSQELENDKPFEG